MIDNFISEFSITNSWNAEKWSRLMEDVKNMTDGDSRKRSMRKLRAIVFAANKFIVNKGNYVTHQGLVNMPIFQSYDKSSIFHECQRSDRVVIEENVIYHYL